MRFFILIFFFVGCEFVNEGSIEINSNVSNKEKNDIGNNPLDDDSLGSDDSNNSEDVSSGTSSGSDSSTSNNESNSTPQLVFSEDFETGVIDSNKWHLYKSHGGISSTISNNNSSKAWNASYSSSTKWHATITTKQSFTLPITIEWDLDMASNYNNGSASEGVCIYEDDPATNFSRDSWFDITSATNLGCVRIQRRLNLNNVPVLYLTGIFFDSSDPRMELATSNLMQAIYFASGNTLRDYRMTLNINADLTFDVTIQYKEDPNTPILFYDHVMQSSTSNFHIQFNNVDYGNYKSYYDNIKIWDGYVAPTSINP